MIKFSVLIPLLLLFLISSCNTPPPSPSPLTHYSQNVMTIDYHITIGDPLTPLQEDHIRKIIDAVFKEIDTVYNKWNPQSELSRLNRLGADTPVELSVALDRFLKRVNDLVNLSEGRFDPTVEPIQQLWKKKLELGKVPTSEEIESLKPCVGWHTLLISNGIFQKKDGRTQLDLGGIAKGYCVDLLIEQLQDAGLKNIYVEWGGEIRTLGSHPSKRPWRVYISRLGSSNPDEAIAEVDLINRALATSGDYFQFWQVIDEKGETKRYCHIFNPKTLTPIEVKPGSVASASLLALDCTMADGLAKVLMLFNSAEEALAWIQTLQADFPDLACWIVTR